MTSLSWLGSSSTSPASRCISGPCAQMAIRSSKVNGTHGSMVAIRIAPRLLLPGISLPLLSLHLSRSRTRSNLRSEGCTLVRSEWNAWLNGRYPDRAALAAAWNIAAPSIPAPVSLPDEIEFTQRGMYVGPIGMERMAQWSLSGSRRACCCLEYRCPFYPCTCLAPGRDRIYAARDVRW